MEMSSLVLTIQLLGYLILTHTTRCHYKKYYLGVSENVVSTPLYPMVLLIIIPFLKMAISLGIYPDLLHGVVIVMGYNMY